MTTKYFKIGAERCKTLGIPEGSTFPVKRIENNMVGGKGFDTYVYLDTGNGWVGDVFIGQQEMFAARGEFVDAPKPAAEPAMHLYAVTYIIGKEEKTVAVLARNPNHAHNKVADSEPEEETITILYTEQHDETVFFLNSRRSKHVTQ